MESYTHFAVLLKRPLLRTGFWLLLLVSLAVWPPTAPAQEPGDPNLIYLPIILVPSVPGDWPQYQHDPARSGYNPGLPPSRQYQEVWSKRFIGDGIASRAQPIVVGDTVLIGTEKGILYAISLNTGAERWQRQLDGAITHTPAANRQAVFVGTLAGGVYALDARTGATLWQFNTPGSFGSAALLVEEQNALYLANRFGIIHALDLDTGAERWRTDLGYPIMHSPAYGDGRIFIGAEDLRLYALDAADGQVLWSTAQLYGRSFHDYAPVYAEGKVIVNTMPDTYTFSKNDLELMKQANVDLSDTKDLAAAQDATTQWLNQNPQSQTLYVFDAATGQPPYVPGVLYTVVNSGAQPPPVYADGTLYTAFHVTGPMWLRQYWNGEFGWIDYSALGRLDLDTGRIVERLASTPGEFTTDETNNYSAAGDIIIGARCQTRPGCTTFNGSTVSCRIGQATLYPFPSDLCTPGSPPIFAHNYILYHAYNTVVAYKGT